MRSDQSFNNETPAPDTVRKRRSSGRKRASAPADDEEDGGKKSKHARTSKEQEEPERRLYPRVTNVDAYIPSAPPMPPTEEWTLSRTPVALKRQAPVPPTPQSAAMSSFTPSREAYTPSPQNSCLLRSASRVQRPHSFTTKMMYMLEYCQPCGKA